MFFLRWLDNNLTPIDNSRKVDWLRVVPFVFMHMLCLAPLWVSYSAFAIQFAIGFYCLRIFSIGAFYHRYFSHKTFKTNRFWQCIFAILGLMAIQRGPCWWAAHHRDHHLYSDQPEDPHSPRQHGFWFSHMVWFLSKRYFHYNPERIKDFARFPELRFLDRFDTIVPLLSGIAIYGLGSYLEYAKPALHTNGLQLFIWGFCISSVFVWHGTFTINSLCHCFGTRPYKTGDDSRNNFFFSLFTLGEGWHNNHHHYPISVRQGFKWWEIDITYYLLKGMAALKIIHSLKHPPSALLQSKKAVTPKDQFCEN